mgnify:CR=1 FL=1
MPNKGEQSQWKEYGDQLLAYLIYDRQIVKFDTSERKRASAHADCPVCGESYYNSYVVPVTLLGRDRKVWIHRDCTTNCHISEPAEIEEAITEQKRVEEAQALAEAEKARRQNGIFGGSTSFDTVIQEIAKQAAKEAAKEAVAEMGPAVLQLHHPQGQTQTVDEHHHKMLDRCLELCARREPMFLVGPTGSGKSYIAAQVAKYSRRIDEPEETLPYYETPCSAGISEGHLLGRLLPTGENGTFEFTHAILSKAYEEGGLACLEEIDAADGNALLGVNNALSTQRMSLPNRIKKWMATRHKDFVLMIIGNTWGLGSDRMYVGRQQLDTAFIDRFALRTIDVDYDTSLEAKLCPDEALLQLFHTWREGIMVNKLRRVLSTRTIHRAYEDAEAAKMNGQELTHEAIAADFFLGWPEDEARLVKHHVLGHGVKVEDNDD